MIKKSFVIFSILSLAFISYPGPAFADVTVQNAPESLITSPTTLPASSGPKPLFRFTLAQTAGETLSQFSVVVNKNGTNNLTGSDIASLAVYKAASASVADPATDLLAGTQTSVNIGTSTAIILTSNNSIATSTFYVTLSTSSSWSGAAPSDSATVTLPTDGIVASTNSPTITAITTNTITADTKGPSLASAVAKNTGGTSTKEAGDSIELTFSETTNKPAINAGNIASALSLSSPHSFLDGVGLLGTAAWNSFGNLLTINLSASSTVPTVAIGDTVTVIGSLIKDSIGNSASGSRILTGTFGITSTDDDEDEDDEDDDKGRHGRCNDVIENGRLYKIEGADTVYLAANCKLKPFRGAAIFHARGNKFQDIRVIPATPSSTPISVQPVLPSGGTLIKGSDATVWFVTSGKHRRGFRTAAKFFALGFNFGQVKQISDEDLQLLTEDSPIAENENHPEGTVLKCQENPTIFEIRSNGKAPFTNPLAFLSRGHTWDAVAVVSCQVYHYQDLTAIQD